MILVLFLLHFLIYFFEIFSSLALIATAGHVATVLSQRNASTIPVLPALLKCKRNALFN